MIGIFDSGSGGLTFLAAMKHRYPSWSYLYYADYEHCPFGDRSPDEIQALTTRGVKKLFDAGASIVVLACNTASAWTLRKLQTEIFPDKKILSVTIPGAEKVVEL
jgi:glutamate racemase